MSARPKILVKFDAHLFEDGDYGRLVELARMVDEASFVDGMSAGEHVAMGIDAENFPMDRMPRYPGEFDSPWTEPIVGLAAVAGAAPRLELMTSILIAPLRPAVVLAKQASFLDQISRGKLTLGVATSWQRAEYEAAGVDYDHRGRVLDDTIAACRALWREAPASFESETVSFTDIHVLPLPARAGGPPVWFGGRVSPRTVRRVTELGDGYLPWTGQDSHDVIRDGVDQMRRAYEAAGRDPESLGVLGDVRSKDKDGNPVAPNLIADLGGSLTAVPDILGFGATTLQVGLHYFTHDLEAVPALLDELGDRLADLGCL